MLKIEPGQKIEWKKYCFKILNLYKKFTKQIAERNFKAPIVAKVDFILELFLEIDLNEEKKDFAKRIWLNEGLRQKKLLSENLNIEYNTI